MPQTLGARLMINRFLISIFAFLFLLSAAAQTGPPSHPSPAIPEDDNARKARAVIDQAIQALGGQAYLTYSGKVEEGRYYSFYHGHSNSEGIQFGSYYKYPDKDRLDVLHLRAYHILWWTVGNVAVKDKNDIVVIHNGDKAYETTYKGTAREDPEATANFLRRRKHSLEWVLRKWINEPGVALFYDGVALAAEKQCDKVTVMTPQNDSVTLFIDQAGHLPVKTSYSWRDPKDKFRNTEEIVYDAYKPVQGIMTPHSVTRYLNGDMSHQRFLNTVNYPSDLSDSLFQATITFGPGKESAR
ncbi:MAG TPA: hypothetical protein VGF06_13055 [Terriglobales bacterium]